ncbi:MAG: T9SS type A sorting domain-containing protein [Ignavibacteriales bacterium]|nr:T9SS type A sorting domain-containing protein [Ignavibacteriales bacterium]
MTSLLPEIAVNEQGTIFVLWNDTGTIVMRRSIGYNGDGEVTWDPEAPLSHEKGAVFGDLAASTSFVLAVWDNDFGGSRGIRVRSSNDEAVSFCEIDTPTTSLQATEPAIRISNKAVHLVWSDVIDRNGEIMYQKGSLTEDVRPKFFALKQNYPNPFNGTTTIKFDLPYPEYVTLTLYNILGQEVTKLVDGFQDARRYEVTLEANGLATGIYFYRIRTPVFTETKKMVILR